MSFVNNLTTPLFNYHAMRRKEVNNCKLGFFARPLGSKNLFMNLVNGSTRACSSVQPLFRREPTVVSCAVCLTQFGSTVIFVESYNFIRSNHCIRKSGLGNY